MQNKNTTQNMFKGQTEASLPPIARAVLAQMRRYSNSYGESIITPHRLARILSTGQIMANLGIMELRTAGIIKWSRSKQLQDLMCWKLV